MKKLLLSSSLAIMLAYSLHADSTQIDVSGKLGLTSVKNDNGWHFKKTMFAADVSGDFGYVIKPRFDFSYVHINDSEQKGDVDSLWQIAFDGIYEWDLNERYYIDPYVFAGLGYEMVSGSREGFDDQVFGQVGLGFKFPITDTLEYVTEFRALNIFDDSRNDEDNEFALLIGISMPFHTQTVVHDSDGDGVINRLDKCPSTAPGLEVDEFGCSENKEVEAKVEAVTMAPAQLEVVKIDSDHDGISDDLDQCPNTPPKFEVNKVGCGIKKTLEVHFNSNAATLLEDSKDKIREFARYMKRHPNVTVTIEGYTDSSGYEAKNMILSQQRADAVKRALIDYNVKYNRITAVGKGSLNPVADNDSKEGRAKNRRIEAIIHY